MTRRGPLTHSFKQRATGSLLGNRAVQTNPDGGGGRLAGERPAGREGDRAEEGGARWGGARRQSLGQALRPHPQKPCWGCHPNPPPGFRPVGDSSRDAVMQNGCDLQCVCERGGPSNSAGLHSALPVGAGTCGCVGICGRVGEGAQRHVTKTRL